MRHTYIYIFLVLLWSCASENVDIEVLVSNPLDIARKSETIAVPAKKLSALVSENTTLEDVLVKDEKGQVQLRQLIDTDQDGNIDEFLFQTSLNANEKKTFFFTSSSEGASQQAKSDLTTFSRIVPERTDDYTWENDKVAFRTYGMEAQRLVEENKPGGTLSSGIDLWLKRVDYSIIDKWYKKNLDSAGYYHKDHGEGYDPYHVGKSRGNGGIGVWQDDTLHTSKNFISYRTIAKGPIRTVFELDYAPWSKYEIKETKRISLDLGSNFSKFEILLEAQSPPPNYALGITLHKGEGQSELNDEEGWFRHWEKIDDAHVGEGIVLDPSAVVESLLHTSEVPDQSQLFVVVKPSSKLTYHAGFGWTKSGQIQNVEEWDEHLAVKARCIKSPLLVEYK